jgi:hypothetical protein
MVSNALPPTRWTAVYVTKRFVHVETRSGYRRNLGDGGRYKAYFGTGVTDAALGRSVLEALNRSRFLDPRWNRKFFEMTTIMAYNDAWIEDLMTRYGFKTKAQLFDKMAFVLVTRQKGRVTFQPHRWAKPEYWYDLDHDQDVVIPETKDAEAVGAALRQALGRCS